MKALTVLQPYATLIADGEKWVENRTWGTRHRGRLAIHAGKASPYLDKEELSLYPTGCVLATVDLVACVERSAIVNGARAALHILEVNDIDAHTFLDHGHTEGPWCWILRNVEKIDPPVDCRGAQGLWNWDEPRLINMSDNPDQLSAQ